MGPQLYTFPNLFDYAHIGQFPPPTLLDLRLAMIKPPNLPPIFSTCFQPPPKIFCPTYGYQFTNQRLICHQCFYQTSNSFNLNLCDHFSSIPSLALTSPTLVWTWVSSLDVLGFFHLGLWCFWFYNHLPIALWHDVQMAFRFPLYKLA